MLPFFANTKAALSHFNRVQMTKKSTWLCASVSTCDQNQSIDKYIAFLHFIISMKIKTMVLEQLRFANTTLL